MKLGRLSLWLTLVLAFSGCSAVLYTPTPHVMPLFDGSRRVQASASLRQDNSFDAQITGSPVPHVFLFGSTFHRTGDRFEHQYNEAGGGLYLGLPSGLRVELLAGAGRGNAKGEGSRRVLSDDSPSDFVTEEYSYTAESRRSFAQVNLGAEADGNALVVGGAMRLSWARYDDFVTEPEDLVREVRGVFAEPAVLFRARVNRYVDLEGQIGHSYRVAGEGWELFRRPGSYGSVGIRLHLGRQ